MTKTQATIATPNAAIAPVLLSQIHDAPGRGILPNISPHSAVTPQLYELDAQPIEQISELLQRQYLSGNNASFVKWTAKKGCFVPLHHHVNEQISWIMQGVAEAYSQGRKYTIKAGDIIIIPPNIPHEFMFLEDTINIDIFIPARQDWADGTATYYAK